MNQVIDKIKKREAVILSFENIIQAISWSLCLSTFIINKNINLSDISHVSFSNIFPYLPKPNWNNSSEYAEMLPLAVCAFYISACGEGYFDLFDGKEIAKENNSDLYCAQKILRIIRNSLTHPYISSDETIKIRWNVEGKRYKEKLVVKAIDITLDATNLDQQDFKLDDLGGWPNFIKLLEYLKIDLQEKASKIVK